MLKKALLSPRLLRHIDTQIYMYILLVHVRVSKNVAEFPSSLISVVISIKHEVLFINFNFDLVSIIADG